ncbi:amidase [Falsihalocynthiibacter sp. BN13B15]|uniref:amidase n=1 Tax=Falsihalocynthiibacter sp. BN13B15 TaxID=3240871 RepID=UPI00350F5242
MDWLKATASDLGRAIGSGDVHPVELTQCYLDAINTHPLSAKIYTQVTRERALAEAAESAKRARIGARLGLLDGVPVSWKDLFDSAGVATEAGSDLLAGRVPESDAEVLKAATFGGSVCLGKTHMSELAFSGLGLNPVKETPPCVNDAEAVPGGSSSGAATSVAYGLAPIALGSDTGGSVRIPAAWNDLVGLKTTSGRISCKGVVPLCERFDTVGPLCRSVEDAAQALALIEGRKPVDLGGVGLGNVRLGVLQTIAQADVEDKPALGFNQALTRLNSNGAQVEDVIFPELHEAMALSPILFSSEAYGTWKDVIEANPEKMFPEILERFRSGATFLASDFVAGWRKIDEIRAKWNLEMAGYDAIVLPTAPILPPNQKRLLSDHSYYSSRNLLALRNTRIGNLLGLSALTLPTSVASAGFMLMGKPMGEEALLRIGRAAEIALAQ